MNKKRFSWKTEKLQYLDDEVIMVVDNENKDWKGHILNVVDLLNNLTEENEQLRHEIEIEKKWQLEKDKYYAKIKEENEKLKNQNTHLNEINKELGDDLYNCRLNKKIIGRILKLSQDTLAEYDIYTIKDFRKLFELDAKINKEKDDKIKELEV